MYFGNKTIGVHLMKGLLGLVVLGVFLSSVDRTAWSLILLPLVLYLWKGCPMCWTLGLIETVVMTIHKHNERNVDPGNPDPNTETFTEVIRQRQSTCTTSAPVAR